MPASIGSKLRRFLIPLATFLYILRLFLFIMRSSMQPKRFYNQTMFRIQNIMALPVLT